jgi:phospholipid/cholesterol/gamma-HCH transport system ATP-binding protein
MISLHHVYKSFGSKKVIDNLSLEIIANQTTVIAGQSGSGKSVLLKLMNGLVVPDQGEVFLFGENLAKLSEKAKNELRQQCTMVFQNYALIDSLSVIENVAFPLIQSLGLSQKEARKQAGEVLETLDLGHAIELLPASLSGGMKKRVSFARAVVTKPKLILFDEPTTGLDPVMISFVDDLMIKMQKDFDLTSVVISHDMHSNQKLADRLGILAEGKIVQIGTYDEIVHSSDPIVKDFISVALSQHKQPSAKNQDAIDLQDQIHIETSSQIQHEVEIRHLFKTFGNQQVLKDVSLNIPQGKITVIIGGSGSGKSVLVKHILGLFKPDSGDIQIFGQDLLKADQSTAKNIQSQIAVLFQGAALFDSMSVLDNILFPLVEGRGMSRKDALPKAQAIAEKLGVSHLLHAFPDEISNGERKRVALSRGLICQPKIMIYDEPTTGQDPMMMHKVDEMIVQANREFKITSIVISHDMSSTFRIADQIAMIYKGELLIAGSAEALQACQDPRVQTFIRAH